MERRIQVLAAIFFISGCTADNACIKTAGDIINYTVETAAFKEIEVHDALEIELVQSDDTLIEVETRENLKNFISFEVIDQKLVMKDMNDCNWIRDYEQTKVKIYHPNLSQVTHLGSNRVYASDTLYYPKLVLFSKAHTGDFDLILNNIKTVVSINDVSNVYLSGKTKELVSGIYAGDGRVEAENLKAEKIRVFHRGTNDMLLYPVDIIEGELVGLGDVILYNNPDINNITVTGAGSIESF